jgi:uncharacterized glyoxalase superfamily protein PhnB
MKIYNEKTEKKDKDVRLPLKFKEKWVAALRSGKFKQGKEYLEIEGEYCCLGVACKITHPRLNLGEANFICDQDFNSKELSKIRVPAILKGDSDNKIVDTLAKMNDSGASFKKIAAWIEKNL